MKYTKHRLKNRNIYYNPEIFGQGGGVENKAKPIIVNDPNDPRLKTYQDSLRLFNLGKRKEKEAIGEFNSRYPNEEIIHHYELPPYDITSRQYKSMSSIQPIGIYGTGIPANLSNNYTDKDDMTFPVYKKPVQPVVYQAKDKQVPYSKNVGRDNPPDEYVKKYPPIYVTDKKDPRIGMYTEKGNQYLYKQPVVNRKIYDDITKAPIIQSNLQSNSSEPKIINRQLDIPVLPKKEFQPYSASGYPMINNQTVPEGYVNKPGNQANKKNAEMKYKKGGRIPQYANGGQIGSMIGTGLGIAASFIPGAQPLAPVLIAGGQQLGKFVGEQIDNPNQPQVQQPYSNPVLPYGDGGQVNQTVNIESEELMVDSKGNIIADFKNKPPHPVNGIDPDGNITVPPAKKNNKYTIISAKHRNKYLKDDNSSKMGIINQLQILQAYREANNTQQYSNQSVPVAEGGYTVGPREQGYYNFNDPNAPDKEENLRYDFDSDPENITPPQNGTFLGQARSYKPYGGNAGVPYTIIKQDPFTATNDISKYVGNNKTSSYPGDPKDGNPTDWNNVANNIVPYVGDTAQLAYNTFSKPRWQDRMYNKEYAKSVGLMSNRRYNVNPQLNMNRQGYGTANYLTRNASGGNAGMYLNQMSANTNNFNQANSQAWAMKQNADNGYMGEEAQFRAGLGAQDTAYGYQNQTDKFESQANRRNNIFAATQNMGRTKMQMNSLKIMDKYGPYAVDNTNDFNLRERRAYAAGLAAGKNR